MSQQSLFDDACTGAAARVGIATDEPLRLAMINSAAGIALLSPDRRHLQVNDSLCTILASDEATLQGSAWQAVTHLEDLLTDADRMKTCGTPPRPASATCDSTGCRPNQSTPGGLSGGVRALADKPTRVRI